MSDINDISQQSLYGNRVPLEASNKALTKCYFEMGTGLLITTLASWFSATSGAYLKFVASTGMVGSILLMLSTLGLTIAINVGSVGRMKASTARILFYVFSALMGFTVSTIFLVYNIRTIFIAFTVSALFFFALSVYGITTKTDLGRLGPILLIALLVLIIAEFLVFFFIPNPKMILIMNAVAVLIFALMTAYDTQQAKKILSLVAPQGEQAVEKASINCALSLYLDFLNLFLNLLRIFGSTSSND